MKALSVRQPWAWLIVEGHKNIENRWWHTYHRGPLLIHASAKHITRDEQIMFAALCDREGIAMPTELPYGGIVGYVDMYACWDSVDMSTIGRRYAKWYELGKTAWWFRDAISLPLIPCKGSLGLWDVPIEVLRQLDYSRLYEGRCPSKTETPEETKEIARFLSNAAEK